MGVSVFRRFRGESGAAGRKERNPGASGREQEITDFGKLLMSNCQYGDAYQTDIARSGIVDENE